MNNIQVTGNIVRDPELRYSAAGTPVCKFSIADTTGKDDTKKTTFHDCVAFKEQAENIAASVRKGQRVIVIGRVEKENYEAKDGTKKTRVEILVDEAGVSLRWANLADEGAARTVQNVFNQVDDDEEEF